MKNKSPAKTSGKKVQQKRPAKKSGKKKKSKAKKASYCVPYLKP